MTLIEAVKSGRKFRRKIWADRFGRDYWTIYGCRGFLVLDEDVLADDWEVEPTPVIITREQFEAAWYRARTRAADWNHVYKILVEELGL